MASWAQFSPDYLKNCLTWFFIKLVAFICPVCFVFCFGFFLSFSYVGVKKPILPTISLLPAQSSNIWLLKLILSDKAKSCQIKFGFGTACTVKHALLWPDSSPAGKLCTSLTDASRGAQEGGTRFPGMGNLSCPSSLHTWSFSIHLLLSTWKRWRGNLVPRIWGVLQPVRAGSWESIPRSVTCCV